MTHSKKTWLLFSALTLLFAAVAVEAQDTPVRSTSIDNLVNALLQVKNATDQNTRTIGNLPGMIETQYRRQASTVIVGISLFIALMYALHRMWENRRDAMKKKTHQQYIRELEERNVENIKALTIQLGEFNAKAKELVDAQRQTQTREASRDRTMMMLGAFVAVLSCLLLIRLGVL